ncbi:FAD-dependent oxidoreductase [uncultured Desulfobulbus sp.]|uniref:NAD(P)/FAD-dependent oxidoreductase n=1 Tax=uncultured Desulfobulbus sp. TaxID=239745 RepID=UPI0029C74BEA|nr:FAD-dependent oxidoreductase [uncultured Desulfobulbus sp.]
MKKQLLLIGGGHAHMVTLANLGAFIKKGYGVTVIQPSEYHYYSGMGPGMLGGTYTPEDIRFATRKLVEAGGGRFVLGKADRIDPDRQVVYLEGSEEAIAYDVLSCNAGSYVPRELLQGNTENIFTAKPIEELLVAQKRILECAAGGKITIAVIGSGPSSLEIAGNIHQLCRQKAVTLPTIRIFGGRNFLPGRPERIRRIARIMLSRKGVEIIQSGYVKRIENRWIVLENGQEYAADIIFHAVGVKPSPIFTRSGLPVGPDGGLRVNAYLQSVDHPNIFGGGDCIYFEAEPLDKVGVYAVRQNPILYRNLLATLEGGHLEKFHPGGKYLLIYNLGEGEGILSKGFITFSGKLAFYLKDRIDRQFIRTFQVSY